MKTRHIIGIDLGGTNFKAGVVSSSGRIVCRQKIPTPKRQNYRQILDAIDRLIRDLEDMCSPEVLRTIQGISVAVPGIVDQATGNVVNCFNIFGADSSSVGLRGDLQDLTRREVRIDKDVNLAAMGEHWIGAGRGYRNLICIFVGTGIGSGIILDNSIFRGTFGAAGEFGHLTVNRDGPRCGCGNRGCVEVYASGPAIVSSMINKVQQAESADDRHLLDEIPTVTAKTVFDLAREGNALALEVIDRACANLGTAIADVITLLTPELIILGGGVGRQHDLMIGRIRAEIALRCRPVVAEATGIVSSQLWDDAAIIGGAKYFFEEQEEQARL